MLFEVETRNLCKYSSPRLSAVSLSVDSVTWGKPRPENIKFPQPLTLSASDIQPSSSSRLNNPGPPKADDSPFDMSSEGQ